MKQPYTFLDFIQGQYSDVSILRVPDNALYLQDNVVTSYKIGAILKRPGYEQIGSTLEANKSILGLHNFRQSASVQKMLATCNDATDDDTQLFYSTGGAWTELTGAETAWANYANIKVEMEDFIGYCFFVGHGTTDGFLPRATLTGTTFGTTNTTSMPGAKYIKRYRDRLYIANCDISGTAYPYRVYFSSVPSAGTITWTVASDFIDVDYSEAITGIEQNWDRLIIFTEYSAYLYDQDQKKKVWDTGCSAHRTIKNSGAYMIWANRDGVWVSSGGFPQNVAGRMIDFIRSANMTTAFAEIIDEEYYLYLGSVTVNGVSYSNCAIVFNIPTGTWRTEEYYDGLSMISKFYSSGEDYLYMGATDGEVHRRGKYTDSTLLTSDDGQPIHAWFQTGALAFETPADTKKIEKIVAYSDRAQGLLLKTRVYDRNTMALKGFNKLGNLTKVINEFQCNPRAGNFLQIEGVENSTNPYFSLFGFTILEEVDKKTK